MPTPMSKYAEIARRFDIDPKDDEAVDRFFESGVYQLPVEQRQSIFDELLDADGESEEVPVEAQSALPKNVRPLSLSATTPAPVPSRPLDPIRDGDELTLVVQWIQRWLNEFLRVSELGIVADVTLTDQNRVQVALAGPDAPRLETSETQLFESMKQLTSRVAEAHPGVEDFVDFVVHSHQNDAPFLHGLDDTLSRPRKEPKIIRLENIRIKPMSPKSAAEALQRSADEFIVFHNIETDAVSVIYKRRDRNLGLIEA